MIFLYELVTSKMLKGNLQIHVHIYNYFFVNLPIFNDSTALSEMLIFNNHNF